MTCIFFIENFRYWHPYDQLWADTLIYDGLFFLPEGMVFCSFITVFLSTFYGWYKNFNEYLPDLPSKLSPKLRYRLRYLRQIIFALLLLLLGLSSLGLLGAIGSLESDELNNWIGLENIALYSIIITVSLFGIIKMTRPIISNKRLVTKECLECGQIAYIKDKFCTKCGQVLT